MRGPGAGQGVESRETYGVCVCEHVGGGLCWQPELDVGLGGWQAGKQAPSWVGWVSKASDWRVPVLWGCVCCQQSFVLIRRERGRRCRCLCAPSSGAEK